MDEYIDREAAQTSCRKYSFAESYDAFAVDCILKAIPAADVAPVRHGRWIEPACLYYGAKQYECSLCHSDTFWRKHSITVKYTYCPNCGCRMDGGDDE